MPRTENAFADDGVGARPQNSPPTLRAVPLPGEDFGERLFALQPRLFAVALRVTRDAEAASDVVQAAFEKALRKSHQFRGESLLSTWMHRIVVNEALMWLRAERRRGDRFQPVADPERLGTPSPLVAADDEISSREDEARVRAAMAGLRPDERDLIARCGLEDESYRDYGRRVGLHPAAVKSRAFRARRQMRRRLEQ